MAKIELNEEDFPGSPKSRKTAPMREGTRPSKETAVVIVEEEPKRKINFV